MSIEIVIDPNVRVAGNRSYGGFEDVRGGFIEDLNPGDEVTVLEEEADVIGDATVYELDYDKQLIYLDVNWSSLRRRPQAEIVFMAAGSAIIRTSLPNDANLGGNLGSTASVRVHAMAG